jgi:hypothetical protein
VKFDFFNIIINIYESCVINEFDPNMSDNVSGLSEFPLPNVSGLSEFPLPGVSGLSKCPLPGGVFSVWPEGSEYAEAAAKAAAESGGGSGGGSGGESGGGSGGGSASSATVGNNASPDNVFTSVPLKRRNVCSQISCPPSKNIESSGSDGPAKLVRSDNRSPVKRNTVLELLKVRSETIIKDTEHDLRERYEQLTLLNELVMRVLALDEHNEHDQHVLEGLYELYSQKS